MDSVQQSIVYIYNSKSDGFRSSQQAAYGGSGWWSASAWNRKLNDPQAIRYHPLDQPSRCRRESTGSRLYCGQLRAETRQSDIGYFAQQRYIRSRGSSAVVSFFHVGFMYSRYICSASTHDGIYTATVSTLSFADLGSFLNKSKIAYLTTKLSSEISSLKHDIVAGSAVCDPEEVAHSKNRTCRIYFLC